jgi:lipopolysaccharide export system permease protein
MFSVLDRYIGRTIFGSIMMTLFMLVGLSGIIKFVDQLRKTGNGDYDVLSAGFYTLLSVPKDIEIFFPMAALLGALLGLGALASNSELVAMEAAGYTRMKVALSVMKTAIPLVLLTMAIGEWVSPIGEQTAREMRAQKMYGGSLLSTRSGLWAKDGNDFIYVGNVNNNNELLNVNIYHFDTQRKLLNIRNAASGSFDTDANEWTLYQVSETDLTNEKQITSENVVSTVWKTTLTPDKLGIVSMNPEALSMSGLYGYIHYLRASDQEASRYELIFWSKVFAPFSVAVMMLMALSFVFGPLRSVPMGVRVVTGISFGFLFYVLDKIFGPLSLVYNLPPLLGALIPSLAFLTLSLYLLRKKR